MYSSGLSVLVQAQVEDLLDGIQPSSVSFLSSGGAKRNQKAITKFSSFYFSSENPELSREQVELVLVGDFRAEELGGDGSLSAKRPQGGNKKGKGLGHLCGGTQKGPLTQAGTPGV